MTESRGLESDSLDSKFTDPKFMGEASDTSPVADKSACSEAQQETAHQDAADWKVFRLVVGAIGVLLAGFGFYHVLLGTKALPNALEVMNSTLESNFRFLSALLIGVGAAFVAIAIKFEWANILVFVCSTIFLGGLARVLSWALSGLPNVLMILLMIAELAVPPVIVVWYLWINRTQQLRRSYRDAPVSSGFGPR